ncbi:MAG TPA: pyridoxamine 5'-phosphate oxidase family protein [Draconibacterium sp.]|nr:pyridoxamine 5'-phosphate oxidase family protein [Draconibacterium sp.]
MNQPDKRIVEFLNEHHVLTLATCVENNAWCAHCYYVWLKDENCFVFTSGAESKHVKDVNVNPKVAGSVVLETSIVGKVQGIQFRGTMEIPDKELASKAKVAYYKKFPLALAMNSTLWVVHADYIKMNDNRLGFGKNLIWESSKK